MVRLATIARIPERKIAMIDSNTLISVAIGGDKFRTTLGSFVEVNEDLDVESIAAALKAGEAYRGGGGAAKAFELRRVA